MERGLARAQALGGVEEEGGVLVGHERGDAHGHGSAGGNAERPRQVRGRGAARGVEVHGRGHHADALVGDAALAEDGAHGLGDGDDGIGTAPEVRAAEREVHPARGHHAGTAKAGGDRRQGQRVGVVRVDDGAGMELAEQGGEDPRGS